MCLEAGMCSFHVITPYEDVRAYRGQSNVPTSVLEQVAAPVAAQCTSKLMAFELVVVSLSYELEQTTKKS